MNRCLQHHLEKNAGQNYHRWCEDTPISEEERTAGLLSLEKRREEKRQCQSEKMKGLPSRHLHFKFEAPTKNRLKRQSPNHLVKALQQKHRIPSSARSQPSEMLKNMRTGKNNNNNNNNNNDDDDDNDDDFISIALFHVKHAQLR